MKKFKTMPRVYRKKSRTIFPEQEKRSKYNAKKTELDGIIFDSKLEAELYEKLKIKLETGEICNLEMQPEFTIIINGQKICKVKLDFEFFDHRQKRIRYLDAKGMDNSTSRLKRKLVEAQCGIEVEVWKKGEVV